MPQHQGKEWGGGGGVPSAPGKEWGGGGCVPQHQDHPG